MSTTGDLNAATESEKSLAIALIALAGVVFAAIVAAWIGMLPALSHTGFLFSDITVVLILACLFFSMLFGGRGFAYGPKRPGGLDRFNLQAIFGIIAIALIPVLAVIILVTTEPSPIEKLGTRQAAVEASVSQLTKAVDGISHDLSDLKNKLDSLEKSVSNLDRASTGYSNKAKEIDGDLKSLSGRIDKLEANPPSR